MPMHMQRTRLRPSRALGRRRSIHPERAKDEDLDFFLWMSRRSRRTLAWEMDQLIKPA